MEYTVRWAVNLDAESPLDAAQCARGMQLDPDNIATVFQVSDGKAGWNVDTQTQTVEPYECDVDRLAGSLRDACDWILESFPHPTDRPENLREWCAAAGIMLESGDIVIPREFRGSLRCLTCGEMMSDDDMAVVEHMAGHHPGAHALSMEACRENTKWVPEDYEKCPRCGITVPRMPEGATYPEALCDECAKAEGFM